MYLLKKTSWLEQKSFSNLREVKNQEEKQTKESQLIIKY